MPDFDWQHPVNHTGVISSTRDALEKLWWNYGVFVGQLSARDGGQGQGYAIIDYALASSAVHAWFCAEYRDAVTAGRVDPKIGAVESISSTLRARVRFWDAMQAIGNATKHRNLSANYWLGGVNMPVLQPDENSEYLWEQDDPSLSMATMLRDLADGSIWYENIFFTPGSEERVLARDALLQNYQDWHDALHEAGPDFDRERDE